MIEQKKIEIIQEKLREIYGHCDIRMLEYILALIASEQQPMVEALKEARVRMTKEKCEGEWSHREQGLVHSSTCEKCKALAKIDAALAKGEGK